MAYRAALATPGAAPICPPMVSSARNCDDGAPARRDDRPIALLVNILSGGGAQRRIATLANRFIALGRMVDVVSIASDGPMTALLSPEVRVVALGPPSRIPLFSTAIHVRRLADYLERTRPSVLMSCVTDVHPIAVRATRRHRVPLVLRASRHPDRSLPRSDLARRLVEPIKRRRAARRYAQADAIVALSADSAEALRRMAGARPIPIRTILNPVVSATPLGAAAGREHRPVDRIALVLGVGRLVEQKDFATLLRAFALLRAERPARLVLLGQGEQARALRALARKLGIADAVEMPGEVDDVAAWMRLADLLVSSSLWEGMQATLIEALAAGCPVVATDCPGGAREALEDGRLGALVPVRDPERMARAMRRQLDRPPDPAMLAAGAARFALAGKAESYLALFDSCRRG